METLPRCSLAGWPRTRPTSQHADHLRFGFARLVDTLKDFVWATKHHPRMIQTWMYAKVRTGMYSDVEGRILDSGDVGNFFDQLVIRQEQGVWSIKINELKAGR